MKVVRADFKTPSRPSRALWLACAVLASLALAATGWAWHQWREVDVQRELLREAIAQRDAVPAAAPVAIAPTPYDASARELLAERAIPWPQALTTLEATAVVGVTPVSVEFGNGDKSIRLEVSFVDYGSLLEYLNALNAGEPELRWKLAQSQAQSAPGGVSTAVIVGTTVSR